MKKIISAVLAIVMLATSALLFASCGKKNTDLVAIDATDLLKEDFGIAVKKGNTALMNAINEVIDAWVADGTMTKYIDYYDALSKSLEGAGETPDAGDLKTTWDFGSATEVITVYTESGFAPFEFIADGNVIGVDIAIMSEVAVKMGKKIEVKDVLFDTITTNVNAATGDAVGAAGITINDDRKQSVDFSNIYFSSTLVIVSAKDKAISSVKDLSGLKVGVQEGTSGDLIISAAKTDAGYTYEVENDNGETETIVVKVDASTTVSQYKQYAHVLEDLKVGRIDAILMDKLPAQTMLEITK